MKSGSGESACMFKGVFSWLDDEGYKYAVKFLNT